MLSLELFSATLIYLFMFSVCFNASFASSFGFVLFVMFCLFHPDDCVRTVKSFSSLISLKEEPLRRPGGKLKQYLSCSASLFLSRGEVEHTERDGRAGKPLAMFPLVMLLWTTSVLKEINLLTLEPFLKLCSRLTLFKGFGDYLLKPNTRVVNKHGRHEANVCGGPPGGWLQLCLVLNIDLNV